MRCPEIIKAEITKYRNQGWTLAQIASVLSQEHNVFEDDIWEGIHELGLVSRASDID